MRPAALHLLLLLGVACAPAGEPAPAESGAKLPDTVRHLVLARRSPEITAVGFPHGLHLDPAVVGEAVACSRCHHTLTDAPGSLPAACGGCHPMEAREGMPPDL